MAKYVYALLLGLLGAALVHIAVILLVPYYTSGLLMRALRAEMPPYRFTALPPENIIAARADPLFKQLFCRFDLAEGPARLSASGSVAFWSLAIYSAKGEALYSITQNSAPGGAADIIAIDPAELMDFKHNLPEADADSALAPLNDGRNFAALRVLVPSADWEEQTEAFLKSAQCAPADY